MTKSSLLRVLGVVGAFFCLMVASPGAQAYPPGTSLVLTAGDGVIVVSNGQPGCTVTVEGEGFSGSGTIDADGVAVIEAELPDGLDLLASVSGPGCLSETANAVVRNGDDGGGGDGGDGGDDGGDVPSRTGSNTALGLLIGLGALGAGGGMVVVASRRRKSAE